MVRVLIVDDSMFMRQVLRDILAKNGHDVVGEADTAEKGMQEAKRLEPDVVTLDLVMPGMGGMEALRQWKDDKKRPQVIVVSAVGQKAELKEALALGAADFILKPFDEAHVVLTLKEAAKNGPSLSAVRSRGG